MRDLLFLSQRLPYPPDKGDKIRAYHILCHLASRYRVHLGCFIDDPGDETHIPALQAICASVFAPRLSPWLLRRRALSALVTGTSFSQSCYADARMTAWVAKTRASSNSGDAFVYCTSMAPYLFGVPGHKVLDLVDVDSEKWRAYAHESRWPMKVVYAREAGKLLALERAAVRAFDRALFVSQAELAVFTSRAPESAGRACIMNNGVDAEYFDPAREFFSPFGKEEKPIIFTGTMDYRPNVEAVVHFASNIFPLMRAREPAARFWIVGANPARIVRKLATDPSIAVTGRVPDVRPFLAHCACAVAPLTIARGVQNKVLEAMAMARAVVATPEANEGIDGCPGKDLLTATEPHSFADAVCGILAGHDPDLGRRAREFVQSRFQWRRNLDLLTTLFPNGANQQAPDP